MGAVTERRGALETEREDKIRALADSRERHTEWLARLGALETRVEAGRRELEERRRRLDALRLEQAGAGGRRAELTREDAELRERGLNREHALARLSSESARTQTEADAIAGRRPAPRGASAQRRASSLAAGVGAPPGAGRPRGRRDGPGRAQRVLSEMRLALAAKESQLQGLEQLERATARAMERECARYSRPARASPG